MFHVPNQFRIRKDPVFGTRTGVNFGAFVIPNGGGERLYVIADDGLTLEQPDQWEHVSVSVVDGAGGKRDPSWAEMCRVKDLFWDADDCVIQFHPPRRVYVNVHPHTLHLWRAVNYRQPVPPASLVG